MGDRLDRLCAAARAEGLEALVLYSNGAHSFLEMDGVWYASGCKPLGESLVLVAMDGPPRLVVSPAWDEARAREESSLADVCATADPLAELAAWVRARGPADGRIGVCGVDKLTAARATELDRALGAAWTDADALLHRAGVARDEAELLAAEQATQIAEAGYRRTLEAARPGMREFELSAVLDAHMRSLGAEDNFLLVSASQHNLAVHAPSDRVLEVGDVILAEISPSVGGQFTQICRTAVIGRPSPQLVEKYQLLQRALRAGLERCRPEGRVADVVTAIDAVVGGAGYETYCRPPYMRTRGHGMGLGSPYPGDLRADSDVVLTPGMLFVLHPNQYLPETGYLLCGEPVVIGADGGRILTREIGGLDAIEVA